MYDIALRITADVRSATADIRKFREEITNAVKAGVGDAVKPQVGTALATVNRSLSQQTGLVRQAARAWNEYARAIGGAQQSAQRLLSMRGRSRGASDGTFWWNDTDGWGGGARGGTGGGMGGARRGRPRLLRDDTVIDATFTARTVVDAHSAMGSAMDRTARKKDRLSQNFRDHGRVVRESAKNYMSFREISFGIFDPIKTAIWALSMAWKFSLLSSGYFIGRFIKHATIEFLDFEKRIAKIQLRGAPGRAPFGQFAGPAMDISRALGVKASDVTDALETATSAGFKRVGDAAAVANASIKLAIGTISEVKPAAEAVTNVLESFAMGADKAGHVADLLTIGMRESTLSMQDFAHGTERLAPIFHQIGGSLEDLVATTALLSHSAHGDVAVFQELAQTIQRLVAPAGKSGQMMRALGVSLSRSKQGGVDVLGTLDAIGERMRRFSRDPAIQQRWLAQIIPGGQGGRSQRALLRLFAETPEDIQRVRNAALSAVGATDKALREQNQTMYRQWQILAASVGRVTLMLGQSFAKLWDPAVKGMDEFLKRFEKTDAIDDLRDHIVMFGAETGIVLIKLLRSLQDIASFIQFLNKHKATVVGAAIGRQIGGPAGAVIGGTVGAASEALDAASWRRQIPPSELRGQQSFHGGGYQAGGIVPGLGRGDVVPAMLEPGELVVPRHIVQRVRSGFGMQEGGSVLDKAEAVFQGMSAAAAARIAERARMGGQPSTGGPARTSGSMAEPGTPRSMLIPEDLNAIRIQERQERISRSVADQRDRMQRRADAQSGRRGNRLDQLRSLQHRRGMFTGIGAGREIFPVGGEGDHDVIPGGGFLSGPGGTFRRNPIQMPGAGPIEARGGYIRGPGGTFGSDIRIPGVPGVGHDTGFGGQSGGSRFKRAPWESGAVVPDVIQAPRSGGPMRMTPHGMRNIPGGFPPSMDDRGGARPMPAGQPGISQSNSQPMSGEQLVAMSGAVRGQAAALPMSAWMGQVAANLADTQKKLAAMQSDISVMKNAS